MASLRSSGVNWVNTGVTDSIMMKPESRRAIDLLERQAVWAVNVGGCAIFDQEGKTARRVPDELSSRARDRFAYPQPIPVVYVARGGPIADQAICQVVRQRR